MGLSDLWMESEIKAQNKNTKDTNRQYGNWREITHLNTHSKLMVSDGCSNCNSIFELFIFQKCIFNRINYLYG